MTADEAGAQVTRVRFTNESLQALGHGTWTEDEQIVPRRQATLDVFDESIEVLEAVWLARGLRRSTTPVTNGGIVPDMPGGAVVSRHLGVNPLESRPVVLPADDDGLPCVDPHQRAGSHDGHPSSGPSASRARAGWPTVVAAFMVVPSCAVSVADSVARIPIPHTGRWTP
jgi:hypothetical protein